MLRGKQGCPGDGGNEEEQKRRKLNAVRQCLRVLEEDFPGPSYRSDLSRISKELHDIVNNEETDYLGSSSTKKMLYLRILYALQHADTILEETHILDKCFEYFLAVFNVSERQDAAIATKTDVKLGLCDGTSERVARPFRSVTGEKNVQHSVSSSNGQKSKLVLAPSADAENETIEDIDEALWAGVRNLSCLQDAHEMLKHLELEVKQEGGKVAETVDRKFDELTTTILSRKRKLCADLVKSIDNYSVGIARAKQYIEEKKKRLIGAIRIAKELKIIPSVRTYCDLTQVIRDLMLPVDAELLRVKSLKEKAVPRLFLNTDEVMSLLQNMGKIEWETSVYEGDGQHALAFDEREKIPSSYNQLPVDNMFPVHKRGSKVKALANKLGIHDGVKKVQELLPVVPHQNIHAVSKSPSSPDVIIEEIYEDNLEIVDTFQRSCLRAPSVNNLAILQDLNAYIPSLCPDLKECDTEVLVYLFPESKGITACISSFCALCETAELREFTIFYPHCVELQFPTENHHDKQRKKLFKKEAYSGHRAGSTELVFVSHVVNPCHFYIRRYSQRRKGAFLEMKLNNFCCNKSSYFLPSDILEPGVRAFVKRRETGMWCRGIVTKLVPIKTPSKQKTGGPMRCRVCDIAVIEIFLIDFGSSEVFRLSRYAPAERPDLAAPQTIETDDIRLLMRKPDQCIEAELVAIPPLAVLCSLKDIVPKSASEGWGEEAKKIFLGMVNNKVVLMTVFREEDGVLIVDLRKPPCNEICSDMPMSLKDTLVFLDMARFKSHLPNHLENNSVLPYSAPKMPREREVVSVTVCCINSPSDFYLQLARSQVDLTFPEKMEEIHEHQDSKDKTIACPVEGQACIAKHRSGNWYRAQIIGLPHHEEVVVKYVDFSSVAKVPLKDIRDTAEEGLSFPGKVIKCRLAYIEPCEAAGEWSRETTERFKEMTEDKFMVCSVVEVLDNILSVELFDSHAACGRGSSINCQLVREDLASYMPGYVESTPASPKETWDTSLEEIPEKLAALNPVNMKALEGQDFKSLSKKELQVIISHVVSPSKIFIQWLSSETQLKSLQEKMDAFYKESQPQSVKWENNMHCAVYVRDLRQWSRGQISRIVSETTAEVLLYDSGAEKTVDISCLRELQEDMRRIETLAIECALADISTGSLRRTSVPQQRVGFLCALPSLSVKETVSFRPTGGSTQWTATVCECISYHLTGAKAKVIIQETIEGSTLPVKILWKDEAGRLIDFSEHLIEKGLAFRNTRTDKAAVACAVPKEYPKVHLEQENPQLSGYNSEPACARSSSDEQEDVDVPKNEQKSKLPLDMNKTYKPPIIPEERIFQAVVSCIGNDGTLYIIPKSSESELKKLMVEIQSNFKCLGLLEPYSWKKEEACVVRGSDSLWYRGKVVEHGVGTLQVQYIDSGCIERVPQCHLYPTTSYTSVPPFCIPCQLYKTTPIGNSWQQDAVDLLQKLLSNEEVEIHVQELPDSPWGKLSVHLYFSGMSISSFMADQKHCVVDGCQEIVKQVLVEGHIPVLPSYKLPPLPVQGDIFPVRVTHFVTPNEVYICLNPSENLTKQSATGGDASCFSELKSLDEALKWCNKYVDTLPLLTDFRTEMPCLVEYEDSLWYRAKLQSVEETDTVKILVQFVDYGNFLVVPTSKLRQIPPHVLKYPVQAVHAMLAGFKPSSCDTNVERIPYCPEWSVKALWAMIDSTEGKQLSASILSLSPEVTIFLYGDEQKLVHMKLIEMGLADLDE